MRLSCMTMKMMTATLACGLVAALALFATATVSAQETETGAAEASPNSIAHILDIKLADGVTIKGRLTLPTADPTNDANETAGDDNKSTSPVNTIVIYVHGTGPATYLTKRRLSATREFNYFDFFAEAFAERGIAFFSYNKRGVTMGEEPPWFDEVDREAFRQVVPKVEADDLGTIVTALKHRDRLNEARVILLGWSEGSIIAALAAERHPDLIDALMLAGYCHDTIYDVIAYQFQGHGSMLLIGKEFDTDKDGRISRAEYESDDERVARYRERVMQNAPFDLIDATEDGVLEAADFAIRQKPMHEMLLSCVEMNNEEWIWNNYFRISVPWLREHFALEPNKTRLLRMDLPIFIFHGRQDAHVDARTVEDLERRFKVMGKTNLTAQVFEDHDHDLNFLKWVTAGEVSEGITAMLDAAAAFDGAGR